MKRKIFILLRDLRKICGIIFYGESKNLEVVR